ncbi:hypothetical protein SEUCBS139899_000107 [Sporothrix eucalyptigena]|uniref:Vacuolar ATPase assembly protein VMA22 n=1 Tax=Sporothrix eucalyptigena TaxID=1812306 RepID=A0ABP0C1B4_9PEZI
MASDTVDELLARYLGLLHEYTELRSQLSSHQESMFGNLARANFAAERGFRYGPDHFDGRMQALIRLEIGEEDKSAEKAVTFAVVRPKKEVKVEAAKDDEDSNDEDQKKQQEDKKTDNAAITKAKKTEKNKKGAKGPRDPLQWFGVLTPMALRQVQQEAIKAIDTIVPRLATVSAEMAAVEIEVRRARKKRARAAAAQEKEDKSTITTTPTGQTVSA